MQRSSQSTPRLVLDLFPASERYRAFLVLAGAVISAAFEVVGVASILPFMAVVMDPTTLARYEMLADFLAAIGQISPREQLVALGVLTGLSIIASNAAAAGALWLQQRFVARTKVRLSSSLFDAYLDQPYSFHLKRDVSSLVKVLTEDANSVIALVGNVAQFIARLLVIVALLALLVTRNPGVAVSTVAVLGGSYVIVYLYVRRRQEELGKEWSVWIAERQRGLHEGLGGVKDLIVLQRERETSRRSWEAMRHVAGSLATSNLIAALPRHLLEPVAFGGILVTAIVLMLSEANGASDAIPTLALYAFVGYRLLPAIQQLFAAAVSIRYSHSALESFHADWMATDAVRVRNFRPTTAGRPAHPSGAPLITLSNVSFRYDGAPRGAIDNLSLEILAGQSVGLVGRSGSGKSTLADLLLGLYPPTSGTIRVGESSLDGDALALWREQVGYVPQLVFLANATIAENVAFGLSANDVDRAAVEHALRQAQAWEFVSRLPEGVDTVVGERGVKLSGGQRQRLGIARAIYKNPSVLVFDEATSALDGLTEDSVMEAIKALSGSRTVILIAHRLRTVEACDRVLMLDAGRLVADGPYHELAVTSPPFRQLVGRDENADDQGLSEASSTSFP